MDFHYLNCLHPFRTESKKNIHKGKFGKLISFVKGRTQEITLASLSIWIKNKSTDKKNKGK